MNNKKGISAIVATVLIILITVAAVTIIWAAIIPMISNQLDKGVICLDAVSQVQLKDDGYICYEETPSVDGDYSVFVHVGRGPGKFELADIQVLVSVGGETNSVDLVGDGFANKTDLPGPNGAEVFEIWSPDFNGADSLQIAPIVSVGASQQSCDISSTKKISAC
jgi:flagellin-like protein